MFKPTIYTVGGTVQANEGGVYISRHADAELLQLCKKSTFAYVLTPRQMGKSSLMIRTAEQLLDEGIQAIIIDLTQIGTQLTADEWYSDFLDLVASQLLLSTNVKKWWQANAQSGITLRLTRFFQEVVLAEVSEPIIIFVDEIDTTLSLDFTDDFYAAIRYLYVARSTDSNLRRLSFVLIGVATPGDLIRDPKRTPFNIGQRVDLTDFIFEEAIPLAEGLGLPSEKAHQVLGWVLTWTGGHPYLTQRLCRALVEQPPPEWTEEAIGQVVGNTFFGDRSEQDNNLQFVRDMLTKRAPHPMEQEVLTTYRDVYRNKQPIPDEEQNLVKSHLKLSGVVRREGKCLQVRNRIYREVFNRQWIQTHLPESLWQRLKPAMPLLASLLFFSVVASSLAIYAFAQQRRADEQAYNAEMNAASLEVESLLSSGLDLEALMGAVRLGQQLNQAQIKGLTIPARIRAIAALQQAVYGVHELNRLEGHTNWVHEVSFSPDGKWLASTSSDGTVKIWSLDGREVRTLLGHRIWADRQNTKGIYKDRGMQFSPDSKTIASASDKTVQIWTPDGQLAYTLPTGTVTSINFHPNGKILATTGEDGIIKLWTTNGHPYLTLQGPKNAVSVRFSPNGKILAAASADGKVKFWTADGHNLLSFQGIEDTISISFSPDNGIFAAASGEGIVQLWDLSGQKLRKIRGSEGFSSVAFSPDSKQIVTGSYGGSIQFWALDGTPIKTVLKHGSQVFGVQFSPDGKVLASAGDDNTVKLWSIETRKLKTFRSYPFISISVSPDGKTLASGGYGGKIELWNINSGTSNVLQKRSDFAVSGLNFNPDGKLLASASDWDGNIRLWKLNKNESLPLQEKGVDVDGRVISVYGVSFSPDGKTLVSGYGDGSIHLWSLENGKLHNHKHFQAHDGWVVSVCFSPDGRLIASGGADKKIKLWDAASIDNDEDPKPIRILQGHTDLINNVQFSPNSKTLVSGSWDKTIRFWRLDNEEVKVIRGHSSYVDAVAFSPDGQILASASNDRTAKLWSLDGKELHTFRGHSGRVMDIDFSRDGKTIISASDDGTIIFWNLDLNNLVTEGCKWLHNYLDNNQSGQEQRKNDRICTEGTPN